MQRLDIHIRRRWQNKGPLSGCTSTSCFKDPFLPVQENLVVFENLVIADVLQPARSESYQETRRS
jgi:hypothetical protein